MTIDQSYPAAEQRVRHHFPDPAEHEKLLSKRFQIINCEPSYSAPPSVATDHV